MQGWRFVDLPRFIKTCALFAEQSGFTPSEMQNVINIMSLSTAWGRHIGWIKPLNIEFNPLSVMQGWRSVDLARFIKPNALFAEQCDFTPPGIQNFIIIMPLSAAWGRHLGWIKSHYVEFHPLSVMPSLSTLFTLPTTVRRSEIHSSNVFGVQLVMYNDAPKTPLRSLTHPRNMRCHGDGYASIPNMPCTYVTHSLHCRTMLNSTLSV